MNRREIVKLIKKNSIKKIELKDTSSYINKLIFADGQVDNSEDFSPAIMIITKDGYEIEKEFSYTKKKYVNGHVFIINKHGKIYKSTVKPMFLSTESLYLINEELIIGLII